MIIRTFDILRFQLDKYPHARALVSRENEQWVDYDTQSCIDHVDGYSRALLALEVQAGDRVLMMPSLATAKWLFLDLAIQQIGAVVAPVPESSSNVQLRYILDQTDTRLCVSATPPNVTGRSETRFLLLDGPDDDPAYFSYWLKKGQAIAFDQVEQRRAAVQPDALAAIVYTSGSTGMPKGVMLSHRNMVSNLRAILPILPLNYQKVGFSMLPFSHIFERIAIYTYIASGASLAFLSDRDYLTQALHEIRPHFFTAVPRIVEKMYEQVLIARAKRGWLGKKIIDWALQLGRQYRERPGLRFAYQLQLLLARLLVFRHFTSRLGGRVEGIIVGAAWLRPELGRLLSAMGIRVREGYGMTETSPVISLNHFTPGLYAFGTVGLPLPGVEVHIDQPDEDGEGEILVRGPNVMMGYYRQPDATRQVIDEEGWFHTGDVGRFVRKRFLQITDRKKDIFKTSAGKYIAPLALENYFRESPFIEQIMIIGFQRPYLTALIKPNFEWLELWCREHHIHWTGPQYMVHNIKVKQKLSEEVDALNAELPNFQTIRKFHLVHQEWTVESGMLTYTLKLVRSRILELYAKEIEALYPL